MKRIVVVVTAVWAGAILGAFKADAADIKEGKWSMNMNIQMAGAENEMAQAQKEMDNMSAEDKAMMQQMMGGMGMKMGMQGGGMSISHTQCITNDNPVPQRDDEQNCTESHTVDGNTVNFESTCDNSHSTGHITYNDSSMSGTIQSTSTHNGQEENATINIDGQYVGPCDEGEASSTDMKDREMALKEKELQLKEQELNLKQRELDMQQAPSQPAANSQAAAKQPSLDDVDHAVNTTDRVKNTVGSLRGLFGR